MLASPREMDTDIGDIWVTAQAMCCLTCARVSGGRGGARGERETEGKTKGPDDGAVAVPQAHFPLA